MPAFDIVCEVNMQELDNVINQTQKEIANRFDFKSGKSSINLDRNNRTIQIETEDELKLRSIKEIIETKMAKRDIDIRILKFDEPTEATGLSKISKQRVTIREGLTKDEAKKIVRHIKELKLKIQAQINDDKVRVTGKKIDELQHVISELKSNKLGLPLNYTNMRN